MFSSLQFAILVLVAAYLLHRRATLRKRRRNPWPAIVEKLQPGLGASAKSIDGAVEYEGRFTRDVIEARARSVEGRQQMFHEAGVMMEMADFAEWNGNAKVAPIVTRVRNHAVVIRLWTAKGLLRLPPRRSPK